ncbi:MAG: hypothetical protein RMJ19_13705 [Gemmatales bacterium]|nr:hypothetical protein [Gemmatales bacterium]MCS7161523.1 hypothetical protein [Gemmatales bacterium]MDW8176726.1 hypothetical protein [Gemmatales bacterium]MDW8223164.1 hypothetical protein [Gemmatales bacterium]
MLGVPGIMMLTGTGLLGAGLAGIFWAKLGTTPAQRHLGQWLVVALVLTCGLLLAWSANQPRRDLFAPGLTLGIIVIVLSLDHRPKL